MTASGPGDTGERGSSVHQLEGFRNAPAVDTSGSSDPPHGSLKEGTEQKGSNNRGQSTAAAEQTTGSSKDTASSQDPVDRSLLHSPAEQAVHYADLLTGLQLQAQGGLTSGASARVSGVLLFGVCLLRVTPVLCTRWCCSKGTVCKCFSSSCLNHLGVVPLAKARHVVGRALGTVTVVATQYDARGMLGLLRLAQGSSP